MVLYSPSSIVTTDFIAATASVTTTAMLSIPANRYFSVEIMISGTQNGVGTGTPKVTLNNSTAGSPAPAGSVVVAEVAMTGLLGIVSSNSGTITVSGYAGNTGATFDFNVGGSTAVCNIVGFLL